eukprot:TRINITY_DN3013_c0_g1_i3.p1 TRINITY_DN3013_c0_g1~~TRINITY_DN3013_c0_g1_i3.p1  ORF type:complete len:145 (+),score=8.73 TRINITY_DN3013_c0_g1_i3:223-657(+)
MIYCVDNEKYEGLTCCLLKEVAREHMWRIHVYSLNRTLRVPVASIVKIGKDLEGKNVKQRRLAQIDESQRAKRDLIQEASPLTQIYGCVIGEYVTRSRKASSIRNSVGGLVPSKVEPTKSLLPPLLQSVRKQKKVLPKMTHLPK